MAWQVERLRSRFGHAGSITVLYFYFDQNAMNCRGNNKKGVLLSGASDRLIKVGMV